MTESQGPFTAAARRRQIFPSTSGLIKMTITFRREMKLRRCWIGGILLSIALAFSNSALADPACGPKPAQPGAYGTPVPITISGAWRPYIVEDKLTFLLDTGFDYSWVYPGFFSRIAISPISLSLPHFGGAYFLRDLGGNFEDSPAFNTAGIIGNDLLVFGSQPIQMDFKPTPTITISAAPCDSAHMTAQNYVRYPQDDPLFNTVREWVDMPTILAKIDGIGPIPVLIDTGFAEYDHPGKVAINKALQDYLLQKGFKNIPGPGFDLTDCDHNTVNTQSMTAHRFDITDSQGQLVVSFPNVYLQKWTNPCASFMGDEAPPIAMIGPVYLQALGSAVFEKDSVWLKKDGGELPAPAYRAIATALNAELGMFKVAAGESTEQAQGRASEECKTAYGACEPGLSIDSSSFRCLSVVSRTDKKLFIENGRSVEDANWRAIQDCHGPAAKTTRMYCSVEFAQCNADLR